MSYRRDTLAGLTGKERARWERRAVDLLDRARRLMFAVIEAHGVEHRLTDSIDNVVHQCEDLASDLRPEKTRAK